MPWWHGTRLTSYLTTLYQLHSRIKSIQLWGKLETVRRH